MWCDWKSIILYFQIWNVKLQYVTCWSIRILWNSWRHTAPKECCTWCLNSKYFVYNLFMLLIEISVLLRVMNAWEVTLNIYVHNNTRNVLKYNLLLYFKSCCYLESHNFFLYTIKYCVVIFISYHEFLVTRVIWI